MVEAIHLGEVKCSSLSERQTVLNSGRRDPEVVVRNRPTLPAKRILDAAVRFRGDVGMLESRRTLPGIQIDSLAALFDRCRDLISEPVGPCA